MTRAKWLLLLLVSILLSASILVKCILSTPTTPPPGVPESWKHHNEVFGRFEVWLPGEWEARGAVRAVERSLRSAIEGDECPLLFVAFGGGVDGFPESILVQGDDSAFDIHAPRVGEELAKEYVRLNPVILADESGRSVYPEPLTDIVTIEQDMGKVVIAYQSYLLDQRLDKYLVRTSACVATRNHVYRVELDTVEKNDGTSISAYESILKAFRVPK